MVKESFFIISMYQTFLKGGPAHGQKEPLGVFPSSGCIVLVFSCKVASWLFLWPWVPHAALTCVPSPCRTSEASGASWPTSWKLFQGLKTAFLKSGFSAEA